MIEMSGRTWIVMEGRDEKDDIPLVCIGYIYNKKKTLMVLIIKGASSTKKGKPYKARFPDKFGNLCVQYVGAISL